MLLLHAGGWLEEVGHSSCHTEKAALNVRVLTRVIFAQKTSTLAGFEPVSQCDLKLQLIK